MSGGPFLDYELPPGQIAQEPAEPRDSARLLVARRADGSLDHRTVRDLPDLLAPGDLLVVNDTRVVPARLVGVREQTGGKWEGLFLRVTPAGEWELLGQTRGRMTAGEAVVTDTGLRLVMTGRDGGHWLARPDVEGTADELLTKHGRIPLPPYIRKGVAGDGDVGRYQTVYAREAGAVAAPTAGLHFTPELLDRLKTAGIATAAVTLHVGLGTFAPLKAADPADHVMHREWCRLPAETADAIRETRARGGRVVAVGTTAVRTLESADGNPWAGETDIYIRPPYEFQSVDALMTNFHLPRTTLLLLVGAFAGDDLIRRAYAEAVAAGYRFFSYGDAMLIL